MFRGLTEVTLFRPGTVPVPVLVLSLSRIMMFSCLQGQAPQYLVNLCQSPMSVHCSIFDLPTDDSGSYHATGSANTAIKLSLLVWN